MIFIMKDEHDETRDMTMARHVLNIHMNRVVSQDQQQGELDMDMLRGYINYSRQKCAPRLTPSAAEMLSSQFVEMRSQIRQQERETGQRSTIPLTLRQLEAVVRISESLAKMRLSAHATERDVEEAVRLFRHSTLSASQTDVNGSQGSTLDQVRQIEAEIRRRLPVGSQTTLRALRDEFVRQGYARAAVNRALDVLARQETLLLRNQRLVVYRVGV